MSTDYTAGPVDLYTWCTARRDAFLDWEHHELAMYPADEDRDLYIVESVVRTLGNPDLSESRGALAVLAERHGLELCPVGTGERLTPRTETT